jgi:hypothetical protein
MSEIEGDVPDDRAIALWAHASKMLSQKGNMADGGNYGWATLRAVALHGLAMQGLRETSEDAAVQLLSLMGEISPTKRRDEPGLFFSKLDALESEETDNNLDDSLRSDGLADTASYMAAESVVSAARTARTYVRERAKVAQYRRTTFFGGQGELSLTGAQSKWVDDDPVPPILLPMAEFTAMADSVIAMRSVWSAIKLENCFIAQKKLVKQISDLRKNIPASSLSGDSPDNKAPLLPIKITSVIMVESESHSKLERVKLKRQQEGEGAMATFFNPYANKKGAAEATIVPQGEERYIMVKFANDLSIPLEIPRCQLEFNGPQNDRIKAPAISFVIPGQTDAFAVQFPFIILNDVQEGNSNALEIKGLRLTCLARSFFLPLKGASDAKVDESTRVEPNLPVPASLYPLRNYSGKKSANGEGIKSPLLEAVPSQPNLLVSFASSPAPIEEDTVIPAPMADGEIFTLPKLCLANDSGLNGLGWIEELRITAVGLPGYSEIILFDLSGASGKEKPKENKRITKKKPEATPLTLTAHCEGMDRDTLNLGKRGSASYISLQLAAATDMGAHTRGCTVTVSLRYRGKAASPEMEVWRKREVEIRVLRIKGPRVSSLTFRPDLSWESAYSELCRTLSHQDKHKRYRSSRMLDVSHPPQIGSTDDEEFVVNRLGKDPGVHACSDKVVVLVSVANETTSAIILSSPNGAVGGFEGSSMDTLRVSPGVSAKIPMILPRVDRAPGICEQLTKMTQLQWKSEVADGITGMSIETGGTMVPLNRRVRGGTIEISSACLKTIIDENPTFLSRICKAPCNIKVGVAVGDEKGAVDIELGKPVDTSVQIELADWVPADVLKQSNFTIEFCCARKDASQTTEGRRDYVWCGQIRKSLSSNSEDKTHNHRARIVFLQEGEYTVSACVSFSRTDIEDDVKEIWWAQRAQHVRVKDISLSQ